MVDFVEQLGRPFFAHRLRRLSEALVDGSASLLPLLGVRAPPKAGSTLLLLAAAGPLGVTEIAHRLRFTHPFIVGLTRDLESLGLVATLSDATDGRRRPVALTPAGRREAARLAGAVRLIGEAYAAVFEEAGVDGFEVVERLEAALARRSFADRLADMVEETVA